MRSSRRRSIDRREADLAIGHSRRPGASQGNQEFLDHRQRQSRHARRSSNRRGDVQAVAVARRFKVPPEDKPLVKGKITLFVCRQHFDYSEFGKMVETRELPPNAQGHFRYNVINAYGCIVPPAPGTTEYSLTALVTQQIAGLYVASLGRSPAWFGEGVGAATAFSMDKKPDASTARWEAAIPGIISSTPNANAFLNHGLATEVNDCLSMGFAKSLMSNAGRFQQLLNAIKQGEDFDAVFRRIYRLPPAELAAAWAAQRGMKIQANENCSARCCVRPRAVRSSASLAAIAASFTLAAPASLRADDKKPDKKPTPSVTMAVPLGLAAGTTAKIVVRGLLLDQASEVHLQDNPAGGKIAIKLLSKGKTGVPDKFEAKSAGDTQVEIEVTVAPDAAAGEANIIVTTPTGSTSPHPLLIAAKGTLLADKKAGSFRDAQPLAIGQSVAGTIEYAHQVHVYRIDAKAGETIVADVEAARKGSLLDSLLTLYDAQGHIVATNDDWNGTPDSHLKATLSSAGPYFLSLIDAYDSGTPAHIFRLRLGTKD